MSTEQAQQLEKMVALERSSQEQSEKVMLLEARVEALEQDNSALQDKASKLHEKAKAKALTKEKKGILLFFDACIFRVASFVLMFALL